MRIAPVVLLALGCTPTGTPGDAVPSLADVLAGDDDVGLVDRAAALDGAQEHDVAAAGAALDFSAAPAEFYIDVDGSAVSDAGSGTTTVGSEYDNFVAGVLTAAAADLVTVAVALPPALAIDLVAQGTVTQLQPNVWVAHNTVDLGGTWVDGTFTVAWVGVGWLAEMRIASSDGQYQGDVWFNGFLSVDDDLGWWDFYDHGQLAGVVEWVSDGQDAGELGLAGTLGEQSGSAIVYTFAAGAARIDFTDAAAGTSGWVAVNPDRSGEVSHPDHAGGARSCWGTDLRDAACPEG